MDIPFFIVGSGRSGTTLLRSMLDAHPRLAVTPETHYLKRAFGAGAGSRDAPAEFEAFWADLTSWRRFRDTGLDPDAVRARIAGPPTFRAVFAAMLAEYAASHGKARAGEKTPGHYRYLPTIFSWFPGTRILAMRRDPRDVVASHLASPWVVAELRPGRLSAPLVRRLRLFHVAERAHLWAEANGRILADAAADPRLHLVVYERLVADPEAGLRAVCAALGEPFDPLMLAPRNSGPAPERGSPDWADWTARHQVRAAAPVSAGSVGRWRAALAPAEAALVEDICGPAMTRLGYAPEMRARPRRLARALYGLGRTEDRLRRRDPPGAVPHHSGVKPRWRTSRALWGAKNADNPDSVP